MWKFCTHNEYARNVGIVDAIDDFVHCRRAAKLSISADSPRKANHVCLESREQLYDLLNHFGIIKI